MNRNESFAAFCNRVAAHVNVRIPDGDYTLPEEYNEKAEKVLKLLASKKESFPFYAITSIQNRLSDMDEVVATLKEKTVDGEIPDAVLVYFAFNLYSKFDENGKPVDIVGYNNLKEPQQNIIKVAAVYFMLQI
jgi:hypothetical protein